MIITPLRPQKMRPVALLAPGFREVTINTTDGVTRHAGANRVHAALKKIEDHVVYVASGLRSLLHTTGAQCWTAEVWRGRAVSMSLDGTNLKVSSLRRTLGEDGGEEERFSTLLEVLSLLSDQGVKPGSLSSMSWNLWRSTLTSPVEIGFNPQVALEGFFGGRKGSSAPHNYVDQVSVDMKSAYPQAMVSRPLALSLRQVSASTVLDPEVSGLARVRVVVPEDLAFAPLPVRLGPDVIQWRHGVVEGVYPWGEVVAARALGCEVEVLRCWSPLEERDLFSAWWRLVGGARSNASPGAVKIVKALSNLVWSGFALNGEDSALVRWLDDFGDETTMVAKTPVKLPQRSTVHVAAEISSRVRVRILLEGLYGDYEPPVHIDTDGIIVSSASAARRRLVAPPDWRTKVEMSVCEIKAPQLYRYQCGDRCGRDHSLWHYVASGTPRSQASQLFETHPGFSISYHGLDMVLPDHARTEGNLATWLRAKELVATSVYGPRLA